MKPITRFKLQSTKEELKQIELMLVSRYRESYILGQTARTYESPLPNFIMERIDYINASVEYLQAKKEDLLKQIVSLSIELTKGEKHNASI